MHLRNEYVLKVVGTVDQRPEGNENPLLDTGEIEVTATEVEVLSAAAPLPFQLDEHTEVRSEEHTSELQSRGHLVCRLLLEKKKPKSCTTKRWSSLESEIHRIVNIA